MRTCLTEFYNAFLNRFTDRLGMSRGLTRDAGGVAGKKGSHNFEKKSHYCLEKMSRHQNGNVTPSKNRECHRGDKIKATVLPIVQRKVVKSSRHVCWRASSVLRRQSTC